MSSTPDLPPGPGRLVELVDRLDCLTDEDLQLLSGVTASTTEQWRRRGAGPAYILAGTRYLYPRAAVAEWLATRLRERAAPTAKGLL